MPFPQPPAPARVLMRAAALAAGTLVLMPAALAQTKPAPKPAAPAPQAAPAAPAAPAGPTLVALKPEPSQVDWTKVCGKDPSNNREICYTTRDFVSAEQGQPVLAVAVYDIKGEPLKMARFLLPVGLMLQPGIRVGIDQGQPTDGKYTICIANGCFAEVPLKEADLGNLKKGTEIKISVQNPATRVVTFQVPLTGFAKAFDGPAIDPKVLEEQQKKLQEELQKRSEDMRKKLETQPTSPSAAAPAAAPGAAPTTPATPKP